MPSVNSLTVIPKVIGMWSAGSIAPLTISFFLEPSTQGLIMITTWMLEFEYLTTLKRMNFDAVKANIQEASIIYKGIEGLW